MTISAHVVEISVFFTGNSNFLDFSLWYDHTTRSHYTIALYDQLTYLDLIFFHAGTSWENTSWLGKK